MALSGSLRTLSLAEIFQTLGRSTATGILRLSSADGRVDVVFDQGWIIGLVHQDEDQAWSVVARLVVLGLIDQDEVGAGVSGGHATLQGLIDGGRITQEQVDEALTNHIFDELCDLFTWDSANFIFIESDDHEAEEHSLAQARANPLKIDVSSLLMESARRLDEWHRILPDLPPDDAVVVIIPGREVELQTRFSDYPERPVMAMVDGVRTIGEIAHDTPITHMDVHTVLFDAVCEGVLEVLTPDEMERRGRDLLRLEDPVRAARLLRACLALEPDRHSATAGLADALQQLGDAPEAADCYATLALSYLQDDQIQEAIGAARRAAAIDESDATQHVLVRCLVEGGADADAAAALLDIGRRKAAAGRIDEARGTLRQVLQIDPANEAARHELARLVEPGDDADNVVVCVECGGQNPRDRDECEVCKAPLFLTCMNCERAVAISDRICVFCGADPHVDASEGRGLRRAGPSTTALIRASDREDAASGKHDTIRTRMAEARAHEEAERYAEALAIWQELAAEQQGNARLTKHIRALQQLVHDEEVERQIDRGHQYRRGRRYHRALRAYRRARQAISSEDPRAAKLDGLLKATQRSSQLTTAIYGAALGILLLVGWLVVQPIYELRGFKQEVMAAQRELDLTLESNPGAAGFERAARVIQDDWPARAEHLGPEAQQVYGDLRDRVEAARLLLGGDTLAEVERLLDAGDWQAAADELELFRTTFGDQALARQREDLERSVARRRAIAAGVPEQVEFVHGLIADGRLVAATAALKELTPVAEGAEAVTVETLLADLERRRERFERDLAAAQAAAGEDLDLAAERLAPLREAAAGWDRSPEVARLADEIDAARRAAREAYARLPRPFAASDLEAFLGEHGASAEADVARRELDLLGEQAERRARAISEGLARWREARRDGRLDAAWTAARDLQQRFPAAAAEAGVLSPLRLETGVPTASLVVGDEPVAAADEHGVVLWWHPPIAVEELRLEAQGFEAARLRWRDLERSHEHRVTLERSRLWSWRGPGRVHRIEVRDDSLLAVAGRALVALGADGNLAWQHQVGSADELLGGLRLPSWARFTVLEDWVLAPVGTGGLRVLESGGGQITEIEIGTVTAPPQLYLNDLLGGDPRLGVIAEGVLHHGPVDAGLVPVPQAGEAIAGPVAVGLGVDRLLLVATLDGRIVAIDDNNGRVAWHLDLQATDISSLQAVGPDRVLAVLDGSRLACVQAQLDHGRLNWELPLAGAVVGSPRVGDEEITVTVDGEVLAVGITNGDRRLLARLPSEAAVAAVVYGERLYAAYRSDDRAIVVCYEGGRTAWRRSLSDAATALGVLPTAVVVGLADGHIMAFAP